MKTDLIGKMLMPMIKGEKGKCPACGEEKLSYFIPEVEDGKVESGFECIVCGVFGTEWYTMIYTSTTWEVKKNADDTA